MIEIGPERESLGENPEIGGIQEGSINQSSGHHVFWNNGKRRRFNSETGKKWPTD